MNTQINKYYQIYLNCIGNYTACYTDPDLNIENKNIIINNKEHMEFNNKQTLVNYLYDNNIIKSFIHNDNGNNIQLIIPNDTHCYSDCNYIPINNK